MNNINQKQIINVTNSAFSQIQNLLQNEKKLYLRIGIKQGGCSGLSYFMNTEKKTEIKSDDEIIDYDYFALVCDPKSLLYLYGMNLDYKSSLIGGGFEFINPNAVQTCGCGKSFNI